MTVENKVGRLCEVRLSPPFLPGELAALACGVRRLHVAAGRPLIACCDARDVAVLPPAFAAELTTVMRLDNARLQRSAILIGDSSVLGLQVLRMVREADNDWRHCFHAVEILTSWLGEILTYSERARLTEFLAERLADQWCA